MNSCNIGTEESSKKEKNNDKCEYTSEEKHGEVTACCGNTEHPDISTVKNPVNPKINTTKDFIKAFENYAFSLDIQDIGYTQFTPDLIINDKKFEYKNAIVLTMEMDEEIIKSAPGPDTKKLNDALYEKFGKVTYMISDYLRINGYATQVAHPDEGFIDFSRLGQKACLGMIGKSGLLISPGTGPGQKISAIFVSINNLNIKETNEHNWIRDYCEKCDKCIKACPQTALIKNQKNKKDEVELISENCIGCVEGCSYCIEACPFKQKEYSHIKKRYLKMNEKLKAKDLIERVRC